MGVDFIREQSGKPWRKGWDKGLDRLKLPSLFDVQFSNEQRTITADLDCDFPLKIGDEVIVQFDGTSTIVCSGYQRIGRISGLPADVHATLISCGSIALGVVERVSLFGNSAELSIR